MQSARTANRAYFRQAYRTGRHGWATDVPSPFAVGALRRVKRQIPGGAMLDVGCGEGRHAIAAARLGFQVTAVDFESLALRRARRFAAARGARGIVFRRADALRLPFAAASFDVALDYGCLHHQRKRDWAAYRAGLLRVLKPGGFYVLSVFTPRFRLFHGSKRPWHIAQGSYRRYFTQGDVRRLFGRNFEMLQLQEERGDDGGFWHVLMRRKG